MQGYELEFIPPRGKGICTLRLVLPSSWCTDLHMMEKLRFVTKHINAQAEKHGEVYELVELVRFAESLHYRWRFCDFYTFNVRQVVPEARDVLKTVQTMVCTIGPDEYELMEWRFRPGPPQTDTTIIMGPTLDKSHKKKTKKPRLKKRGEAQTSEPNTVQE